MDSQNPGGVSKIKPDFRTAANSYRRSSISSNASTCSLPRQSFHRLSTASTSNDNAENYETPKRPKLENSVDSLLNKSDFDAIPGSPWQWRKMKGEIIALKTRLTHQESTIQQLHKVRREMEEVFNKEKKILEIELEEDKQTIKQLELRVDMGRQTIQEAKAAQMQAERDLLQMKSNMEQKVLQLVQDNDKLTAQLRCYLKQESKQDVLNASITKSSEDNIDLQEKLDFTNKRLSELEEKLKEARAIQQKYEVQSVELHSLKVKLESLESDRSLVEEGKHFMTRAAQANELERELHKAAELISSLRESVKGKLLLEEQMASVQHKLERTESLEQEISQLEITKAELLSKIAEYEAIGIGGGPSGLKREINRLQHAEALLTAEEGNLRSQVESVQRQLESIKQEHEATKKTLADTNISHDRLSRFISRLQKKMLLVTRERDSYRQQLDTYETEISGYQNNETPNLLSERIPALERAIEGYRELVAKLESDLEGMDGKSQRDEVIKLKEEIDKLKGELEHRALKGDFNINTKILHFKMNPAAIAEQQAEEKQKALLQEVEQLRAIVGSGNTSGNAPVSSLQAQEMAELQQKHELKITRLKEAFKASSHEYRQACYQLFGWRVDRTKEGQYKLSSQYAESPDDYLFFIVNEDGVNMIETPFSATLTEFIERHLKGQHSVPMFLNAVQSDLFDQQTVTNIMA